MDRLTTRKSGGSITIESATKIAGAFERLAEYEDAEEQGRLIVLPCKAGDTLWFNTYKHGECIGVKPHKVEDVEVSFRLERDFGDPYTSIPDWRIGETAFLTKEEAEAALSKDGGQYDCT